ncbi:ribonuclease T2 [Pyrrhoderma noxium]|uniref:Ribonuclease T2-like n=1 Tax=Pyrrhoderma noxium TaxID=2282107 RepID=A0A286UR70_9AGAM|nr:ribonuclease T2 [Pyrrhoderma noxium]
MLACEMLVALSLVAAATACLAQSPFTSPVEAPRLFSRASGCSVSGQASCHNTTVQNTCCFESPGGLLLQTQFWDTDPSTGPSDSWTIHGLWPDNCDETFESSCDPSRAYTDISKLLTSAGASDTLSFMETNWVDINGDDESFWEHEWSKHGTCMSTLEPSCFEDYSTGDEAVAFFNTVVKLFKTLPTFTFLSNQGITPSTSKTFTYASLTSALQTENSVIPALSCDGSTLNAISWYFNLKGSIVDGTFVPIDAPSKGSCPSSGIKYPPKSGSSSPTTTSGGSTPTNSGDLPSKATITALRSSGSSTGGLLSAGTWSTQTLATYTLSGTVSSFTLKSSKGNCGVSSGQFSCGSGVSSSTFSATTSGENLLLSFGGSTVFSSDAVPSGETQETVFTDLIILGEPFVSYRLRSDAQIPQEVLKLLTDTSEQGHFISVTRTTEEISIVCSLSGESVADIPKDAAYWKCIKIRGPLPFGMTGIMCDFTTPLKHAGISIFALSTWDTDYVLIPEAQANDAVKALEEDGWKFVSRQQDVA